MAEEATSLVGFIETTVELKSSTEKFHDMLFGRPHHASPANIQGCELHEGELGQVGAIISCNYVHNGEAQVMKERIESVDAENNRITYRVLEGDLLKEYKSFVITFQVTPKEGEPGSIAYWKFDYEKINQDVAHPEALLQFTVKLSKEIDGHLLSEE